MELKFRNKFWKRLKDLCEERNVSPSQVCAELGISTSMVSRWKNGTVSGAKINEKIADYFGVSVDYLLGTGGEEDTSAKTSITIPVYGYIAAGIPMDAMENVIGYEEIPISMTKGKYEYIALQVRGDSMYPLIANGDNVIIRKQPDVESGDIAAVLIENECATLKRVLKSSRGISLVPVNPHYETKFFSNEQIRELPVIIIGRAIEHRGRL